MKQAVPYFGRFLSKLVLEIIPGALVSVFAIVYLVIYYLTGQFFDLGESFQFLANLAYWNLAIGFGAMIAALILFTKWR